MKMNIGPMLPLTDGKLKMIELGFNVGDPVQVIAKPDKLGKVVALIEPRYDCFNYPTQLASVVVQPAGRRFTTIQYDPCELRVCRCANRDITPEKERVRVRVRA